MDEDQVGVKETVVEPELESPTTQETPKVAEDKSEEVNPTGETETAEESEAKESGKTANARIRELNAELKGERAKAQSLAEKIAALTGSVEPGETPQFRPQIEPGAEITPEQYQADVTRAADAIVQLRLKQQQFLDRVNRESQEAVEAYQELKPGSDKFDEDLSDSIYQATEAFIRANPTGSVKKFVDGLMKPYKRSIEKSAGQAQENIAKQVSQAALRPTQVKATEKKATDKSIAELEAELGVYS